MTTLNKLAYDVLKAIRANSSDDDDVDIRYIYQWINDKRALWIYNSMKPNRPISDNFMQDFGEFNLSDVTGSAFSTGLSRQYKVTSTDVPSIIMKNDKPLIHSVTSADDNEFNVNFPVRNYQGFKFSGNGRFNSEFNYSTYLNTKIYVVGNKDDSAFDSLAKIRVYAVAEDPTQVSGFDYDGRYPINQNFVDYIKEDIKSKNINWFLQERKDDVNNANNDLN